MGLLGGLNVYQYSGSNPIRFSDPAGTAPIDPSQPYVPQAFGLTFQHNQLHVGPLSPPPSSYCSTPICQGVVFNLGESSVQLQGSVFLIGGHTGNVEFASSSATSETWHAPADSPTASSKKDDGCIGEPDFAESLIPIWGSGRAAINHFHHGNWVRGILYTALAISDIFLVKSSIGANMMKFGITAFYLMSISSVRSLICCSIGASLPKHNQFFAEFSLHACMLRRRF